MIQIILAKIMTVKLSLNLFKMCELLLPKHSLPFTNHLFSDHTEFRKVSNATNTRCLLMRVSHGMCVNIIQGSRVKL